MLKNYIEENKEEEHTGTKKADTDAGKESIKDGFEKAQEYIKALKTEKFPKKNMFLIMFLLGALLFVIVSTGSLCPDFGKRRIR